MEDSSKKNQQSQLESYFLKMVGSKDTGVDKDALKSQIYDLKFENVNLVNEKKNLEF